MATAPNVVLFIGRFHPLLVHLPIGFLTLLALIEILCRFRRFRHIGEARGAILLATVVATVITITCGLMLSAGGGYDSSLIFWHKWLGITLGIGVITCAAAFWMEKPRPYAGALLATLLLLGPASHLGGSMSHGSNYLFAYAPLWLRPASSNPGEPAAQTAAPPSAMQADVYNDLVRPIIAQNCLACHGSDRTSGNLRLDSVASILRGGEAGPAIIAKNAAASLLIQRVSLPLADGKHMPPDGKPQPSADQIAVLKWWIDNGASEHTPVRNLMPSHDQLAMIGRLLNLPSADDAPAAPPLPIASAQAQLAALSPKIGIVATPVAVDQPWVIINAQLNHALGDAELAQLAPLALNIVDLNLAGTHITNAGLQTVGTMLNLKRLRLDQTSITDPGLVQLGKLKKLEYLNLCATSVTNAALTTLAPLPALQHLYLWKTKVDPAAAEAFAASKVDASKLSRLKEQIRQLQTQINNASVDVVLRIAPSTQPAGPSAKAKNE